MLVPHEDLDTMTLFEQPPIRFANLDLIFKQNGRNEYFLFESLGHWSDKHTQIPELNFENVFDESTWLDRNNAIV